MFANHNPTNVGRAIAGWGSNMPEWVRLLASACDRLGQREVARQLGKSHPYVNRVVRKVYAGDYGEAETLVRAKFSADRVPCPLFGEIPLASCVKLRRRKATPQNHMHHACARTCPDCPNNTDRPTEEEE